MRRKRLRQHRPTMSIEVHYVSYKDYLFLQDMIDNPSEPNEKLKALFATYDNNSLLGFSVDKKGNMLGYWTSED